MSQHPRRTFSAILCLFTFVIAFRGQATGADSSSYLDALIVEVLGRNPALIEARERSSASGHLVLPAGSLPDPKVGFSLSNFPTDNFSRSREPMTSIDVFLTQKIPFPGKLSLKEEIAEIHSQQAGKSVSELENMLVYRTKRAYFSLYEASRAVEITRKTKAILRQFLELARQRYTVGEALQQDVFRAQTGVSNIERKLFDMEKREIEVAALINTLRSRPLETTVPAPSALVPEEVGYTEEELMAAAREANPTAAKLLLKVDEGKKGVSLARRDRYPDFALSTRYRFREERSDFLTGAVTLNLPIFAHRKQNEVIQGRMFALKSSESAYQSYLETLRFQIRDIKSDLFSLKNRIALLESAVIPEARHAVESALSAYKVGKLEFNSLIRAEIDLFQYELELAGHKAKYNGRIAELWMVVGKKLTPEEVSDE